MQLSLDPVFSPGVDPGQRLLPAIETLREEGPAPEEELASTDRNPSHMRVFVSVMLCIWRVDE